VWEERKRREQRKGVFSIIMSQLLMGITLCTFEIRMLGQFWVVVKDGIEEDD
jgi:hypothetical protein